MAGIRIGGVALIPLVSPPWTAYQGTGANPDEDPQVFRWSSANSPGDATVFTDFSGFTVADQCHNPVLSPDGTKILFEITSATTGFREVWVVDAVAGSTPTQLVADASNYAFDPFWGPDSDTFVYVLGAGGALSGGTIYKDTVSSPGTPTSLKAAGGGLSPYRPMFNFDGTRVAYIMDQDVGTGSGEVRIMDADGSNDAAVFSTLSQVRLDNPAQMSWANTMNVLAFEDGASGSNAAYVVNDDGTGLTQINANGDAAGAAAVMSAFAWPANDTYVVIGAHIGTPWSPVRCELDGSDTTQLGTIGGVNQNYFKSPIVYQNMIWFITATDTSTGGTAGRIGSMALDGTGEVSDNFDSSDGPGDLVRPFVGGDGWYYN